jgi:hypothetical protein
MVLHGKPYEPDVFAEILSGVRNVVVFGRKKIDQGMARPGEARLGDSRQARRGRARQGMV